MVDREPPTGLHPMPPGGSSLDFGDPLATDPGRHGSQHNGTQHNGSQRNGRHLPYAG
jgi:hypothetical protein